MEKHIRRVLFCKNPSGEQAVAGTGRAGKEGIHGVMHSGDSGSWLIYRVQRSNCMRNNQGKVLGRGLEAFRDPGAVGHASVHSGLDCHIPA